MEPDTPQTVVVVDDAPFMRRVVARLCDRRGALKLVGSAGDGPSGVDVVLAARPGVAIIDLDLPGFDGLEVCRRVTAACESPPPRLVLWSGRREPTRRELREAGVDVFVGKAEGLDALLDASTAGRIA